jgi:hypothetical protein
VVVVELFTNEDFVSAVRLLEGHGLLALNCIGAVCMPVELLEVALASEADEYTETEPNIS